MEIPLRAVYARLPRTVGGFCAIDENGERVCVLNCLLSKEHNLITYLHEISHINDNGCINVDTLEKRRHLLKGCS